jgi:uncharacterized protein YbjT (DUF2867 family)
VEAVKLPHVQFIQGDFDDPDSIRRACAGVESTFLLSNSTERAEKQQIAFAELAKESGVRHIVKLSQLHADMNPTGRFLRYHGAVEAAIEAAGVTFTFLRPNLYMQGLLNFRQSIKEKSAFFAAADEGRVSAVDVRDLADVAVAALTGSQHNDKRYSLTGPEALTFGEWRSNYRRHWAEPLSLSMLRLKPCEKRWLVLVSRPGKPTVCLKNSRCIPKARLPMSKPEYLKP